MEIKANIENRICAKPFVQFTLGMTHETWRDSLEKSSEMWEQCRLIPLKLHPWKGRLVLSVTNQWLAIISQTTNKAHRTMARINSKKSSSEWTDDCDVPPCVCQLRDAPPNREREKNVNISIRSLYTDGLLLSTTTTMKNEENKMLKTFVLMIVCLLPPKSR